MKIESIHIEGFGIFKDKFDLTFSPHFNLIYGTNEAGKSTMLQFIVSMLYGMKQEGIQQRRWLPEHEKYKPWNGKQYGGRLVFIRSDGIKTGVIRNFDEDADETRLFDEVTGKEITEDFGIDKTKERTFAREIIGLNRALFFNSVCIRQLSSVIEEEQAKTLAAYARRLIDSGGSEVTTDKAVEIIHAELSSIGKTDRGRVFSELKEKEKKLKEDIRRNREKREEIREWKEEYNSGRKEQGKLKGKLQQYRSLLLAGWIEKAEKKLSRIKELNKENEKLEGIIKEGEHLESFNADDQEKVVRLSTELNQKKEILNDKNKKIEKLREDLHSLESDLKGLKHLSRVSGAELDQFAILQKQWLDLKEDLKRKERKLKSEQFADEQTTLKMHKLEAIFSRLPRHIDQIFYKHEIRLRELKQALMQEKTKKISASRLITTNGIKITFLILAVVFGAVLTAIVDKAYFNKWMLLSALVAIGTGTIFNLFKRFSKIRNEIKNYESAIDNIENEKKDIEKRIEAYLKTTGSKTADEFIAKYNTYVQSVSGEKKGRQEHLAEDIEDIKTQIKEKENEMLLLLEKAYPGIRPDKISPELTERYVTEGRHFVDLKEKEFSVSSSLGLEKKETDELAKIIKKIETELNKILKESNVSSEREYIKNYEVHKRWKDAAYRLKRNAEEIEGLLENKTIEDIEKEIEEMKAEAEETAPKDKGTDRHSEMERKEAEEVNKNAEKLQGELSELKGKIEAMEEKLEDMEKLESELGNTGRRLRSYRNYRESLQIAINQLDYVSQRMHHRLAPVLAESAGDIIKIITDGKYHELKIDEDLNVNLVSRQSPYPIPAESLSFGTLDQIYLALRLAITDLFCTTGETLPVILDDSFTQYDDSRAYGAMTALKRLSDKYQILMFTCHNRDRENYEKIFADRKNARLIELE